MPKIYKIVAIIEPGKTINGKLVTTPQTIRENILSGVYNKMVAEQLHLPLETIPKFKVFIPKRTNLIKISVESSKPQQAVLIVQTLLSILIKNDQKQLEEPRALIHDQVKAIVAKKNFITQQMQLLENQVQQIRKKIIELKKPRNVPKSNSQSSTLDPLLYLQNQQLFLNNLQQKLVDLRSQEETAIIEESTLRLKLASIKGININKQPDIPDKPVKPKKALMAILGLVLGLIGGIMLAFLAEFTIKVREQMKEC